MTGAAMRAKEPTLAPQSSTTSPASPFWYRLSRYLVMVRLCMACMLSGSVLQLVNCYCLGWSDGNCCTAPGWLAGVMMCSPSRKDIAPLPKYTWLSLFETASAAASAGLTANSSRSVSAWNLRSFAPAALMECDYCTQKLQSQYHRLFVNARDTWNLPNKTDGSRPGQNQCCCRIRLPRI
jgi:hypothetical protein